MKKLTVKIHKSNWQLPGFDFIGYIDSEDIPVSLTYFFGSFARLFRSMTIANWNAIDLAVILYKKKS
jgi:hypothetical protein